MLNWSDPIAANVLCHAGSGFRKFFGISERSSPRQDNYFTGRRSIPKPDNLVQATFASGSAGPDSKSFVSSSPTFRLKFISFSTANLSRAMQWVNVSYSVWFNHRHGRAVKGGGPI